MNNKKDIYFPEDCIIKDKNYEKFKTQIICYFCKKVVQNPKMCQNCKLVCCEECLLEWTKSNNSCPNGCVNAIFSTEKERTNIMLSTLNYICKNCKAEVNYDDIDLHLKTSCKTNADENTCKMMKQFTIKRKLIRVSISKISGKEINKITSKFIDNNLFSYYTWKSKCWKN
jgi:hypothetical protein